MECAYNRAAAKLNRMAEVPKNPISEVQANLSRLRPKQVYNLLKSDAIILFKVCQMIFLARKCAIKPEEIREGLKRDVSVLSEKFPPLLGLRGGTVLEQLLENEDDLGDGHSRIENVINEKDIFR